MRSPGPNWAAGYAAIARSSRLAPALHVMDAALEVVEATLRLTLRKHEVAEGRLFHIAAGKIAAEKRFRPDPSYRNRTTVQPVATPHEGVSCLAKLATLAT